MSDDLVKRICDEWIADGCADECFWEEWPECPTEDTLTPRMIIDRIEALEAENARLKTAIATHGAEACGILRSYHQEDGTRLWLALRAVLDQEEQGT